MRNALRFRFVLIVAFVTSLPALARAGDPDSPGHEGFVAGMSLGGGSTFPCPDDTCSMNAAGAVYLGAMVRRDFAILADFSVVRGEKDKPGSLGVAALAVQYWPAGGRFWFKAGVGASRTFDWREWGDARNPKPYRLTAIAGAGFEVLKGEVFVVDLQARTAFTDKNQSVTVGVGFNWF